MLRNKKISLITVLTLTLMMLIGTGSVSAQESPRFPLTGFQEKARVIITTDGECDDYNSLHHVLLYANDMELAGIVYSASTYHWQGDGEHTLKEINPDYLPQQAEGIDNGEQTIYRPQEMGWIEQTIEEEYGADYEFLVQNDPEYPSPEELLAVTKVGNVEFEGDVRFDTEGSDLIKNAILDDDDRSLFIQAWGGFNTVARALLSIYEEFGETEEWDAVYDKVINKVIIQGNGQDATYSKYITDIYPDLYLVNGKANGYTYFAANTAPEFAREYFNSEWLAENIKFDHGKLNEAYHLVADGTYYEGEMELFQFGMKNEVGFTESSMKTFDQYDWLAEGDSVHWLILTKVGLRGLENGNYGTWCGRLTLNGIPQNRAEDYTEYNPYTGKDDKSFCSTRWLPALQEDWAARSDWTVAGYEDCNHPPVVTAVEYDIYAQAGDDVMLSGSVSDPDGDDLLLNWWIYKEASEYDGDKEVLELDSVETPETLFTIPSDAVSGDYFNIILEVKDEAEAPFTRYAQIIVHVE